MIRWGEPRDVHVTCRWRPKSNGYTVYRSLKWSDTWDAPWEFRPFAPEDIRQAEDWLEADTELQIPPEGIVHFASAGWYPRSGVAAWLRTEAARRPDVCRIEHIGTTPQGREILVLSVGETI